MIGSWRRLAVVTLDPMNTDYPIIVIGCGGLGSAAAYWLARDAGSAVLGLEQFRLGHDRGASQDHSRIIRLAQHQDAYAALAPAAYDAWHEVEAASGVELIIPHRGSGHRGRRRARPGAGPGLATSAATPR